MNQINRESKIFIGIIVGFFVILISLAFWGAAFGATLLFPTGGGTGIASTTSSGISNCLQVASSTPFDLDLVDCGSILVTQSSHGFSVGDVLRFATSTDANGLFYPARANSSYEAEAVGMVSESVNSNNFRLVLDGQVRGLTGLESGSTYYLSASTTGDIATGTPTLHGHIIKPVGYAISTTTFYFHNERGVVVGANNVGVNSQAGIVYNPDDTADNIDFYNPKDYGCTGSAYPYTLILYAHGNSFGGAIGSPELNPLVPPWSEWLSRCVAVATVDYTQPGGFVLHLLSTTTYPMYIDIARAVQYFRYHADTYNIDPQRVVGYGVSAGFMIWAPLAYGNDYASTTNSNPLFNISTRPNAMFNWLGQTDGSDATWDEANISGGPWGTTIMNQTSEALRQSVTAVPLLQKTTFGYPYYVPTYSMYNGVAIGTPPITGVHDPYLGVILKNQLDIIMPGTAVLVIDDNATTSVADQYRWLNRVLPQSSALQDHSNLLWIDRGNYITPTTASGTILVNAASSTITNLVTLNSTSTNATTTNLYIKDGGTFVANVASSSFSGSLQGIRGAFGNPANYLLPTLVDIQGVCTVGCLFGDPLNANYTSFDADGDIILSGTADLLVGNGFYAFKASADEDAGLQFSGGTSPGAGFVYWNLNKLAANYIQVPNGNMFIRGNFITLGDVGVASSTIYVDGSKMSIGPGSSTQASTSPTYTLSVIGSLGASYLNATTTTATSTLAGSVYFSQNGTSTLDAVPFFYSQAAGFGGHIIMEDEGGDGCTEVTTDLGVVKSRITTCPTEL